MTEAVIVDGLRTPIGRYGGVLAGVRPDDLAALVLKALLERLELAPELVEDVYLGCTNQAGEDNRNVARMAALLAGFPVEVAGCTVNRLCGSGLEAVLAAARAVIHGDGRALIAGGVESMSRAPWATPKPEQGQPRGDRVLYDTALGWRFINPRMQELHGTDSMGQTAENLAEMLKIGREEQDQFALESHRKAVAAQQAGAFDSQLVPVPTARGMVE
ncbi:MAG: 3-oxoadipyl-CoA thiolase, partial [Candidatus Dormibacteria bacterium]